MTERNLEGEGNDGVEERHEEVGNDSSRPTPDNLLPVDERWVTLRFDEFHVDRKVEGVGEE